MHIQFFGLSSFKFTTKEATVVTNPFGKESGLTPPRGSAEIIILSEKSNPLYSATSGFSGNPFIIPDPGEYDLKGVTVAGIPLEQGDKHITVYLIESEDIKILDLGHIKEFNMKEDEVESLGEIDILILPVGGHFVLDASSAAKAVNEIEPKMVIPSHYHMEGLKTPAEKLDTFIKEMGGKSESMDKIIVKKKDLSGEGTRIIVLEPLR